MSYTTISASQTLAGAIVNQSLMDAIRNNLDDHETRISSLFAFGNNGIIDDFLGKDATAPDPILWTTSTGGGGTLIIDGTTHSAIMTSSSGVGRYCVFRARDERLHQAVQNYDMTTVLQIRIKATTLATGFFHGWQDSTLADTGVGRVVTNDCAGFIKGTGTTWKFRFANGGAQTDVDSIGNPAAWGVLRITMTGSTVAASRILRVQSGTTEANLADITGSPFTNPANMPIGKYLHPSFAMDGNVASNVHAIDYVLAYTTTRPLAP